MVVGILSQRSSVSERNAPKVAGKVSDYGQVLCAIEKSLNKWADRFGGERSVLEIWMPSAGIMYKATSHVTSGCTPGAASRKSHHAFICLNSASSNRC